MYILRVVARRHLPCPKNVVYKVRHLATQTKSEPESELMVDFKVKLPAAKPKLPKREPFAKNLFLGNFDYEFLTYPEPQHYDRYNEFEVWLQPIQNYMKTVNPKEFEESCSIPGHVLQKLRELGVFRARIPENYQGVNLINSEFMRLLETVGQVPALGFFLLKHSVPALDIFNKYCSIEQKLKYLPNIANGQSFATVAVTEKDSGPIASNVTTTGTLCRDDDNWMLDGEKIFVANSNQSNVFIVFGHALQSGELEKRPETLSSFIVDLDTEGVNVIKDCMQTTGLKGFNTGKLLLKNVKIPKKNLIGEVGDGTKQMVDLFTNGRHYTSCLTIPLMKNLLDIMTKELIHRKHFDKMLYDVPVIQTIISNLTCSIYAIESVLYLTTSLTDIYEDQDMQLEMSLTEQFCVQECLRVVQESIWAVGPRASLEAYPFEQILRDAFTLANYETSLLDTKTFSALLGLQHFGLNMNEKIRKERNPLMFPKFILTKLFKSEVALKLHLEEYLHPSLLDCADFADRSLFKLKQSTECLLIRYGSDVGNYQNDLHRLSEMIAQIYVYIAIVGRASRSYCIGHRDADFEIRLCMILAYRLEKKVSELAKDIEVSEFATGDYYCKELSNLHFDRKNYFAAHPLKRNY